jgi:hypothetical protein
VDGGWEISAGRGKGTLWRRFHDLAKISDFFFVFSKSVVLFKLRFGSSPAIVAVNFLEMAGKLVLIAALVAPSLL